MKKIRATEVRPSHAWYINRLSLARCIVALIFQLIVPRKMTSSLKHVLLSVAAFATFAAGDGGLPLPPKQDPWYTAPAGFHSTAPGTILRVRTAPDLSNLTSTFGNASTAYNVLFRSTDSNYKPTFGVTTLFVPAHAQANDSSLLSYQIPYNSPDLNASPSYAIYSPALTAGLIASDINTALQKGWYVNVPDHEGPHASFGAGVQEGHATLDSIRAVLAHLRNSITSSSDPRVALWGYSGGSIASEFALELAVQYAPDLSIAGAALGGLVPNISHSIPDIDHGPFAGLLPAALVGFSTQHPAVHQYLLSQLKPSGPHNASTFLSVLNMTIAEAFPTFAGQKISSYFQAGAAFFTAPVVQNALATDLTMGFHGIPKPPLYVYKAVHDEVSNVTDTDALVERFCQVRARILYERNRLGGHLAEETNGDARALAWLERVFAGGDETEGCTVRNVAVNVTDSPL